MIVIVLVEFEFLRIVCPSAETKVPVTTSKVNTSIKTSSRFIFNLLNVLILHLTLVFAMTLANCIPKVGEPLNT
jgi:hypothetical protein